MDRSAITMSARALQQTASFRERRLMYLPGHFAENDRDKLHEFMMRNSFALFTSIVENGLVASHLPVLLNPEVGQYGELVGHMARANTQWRDTSGEVMVVFSGPHVYLSPSYYESASAVPTWNYLAVHAYGRLEPIEDQPALFAILARTVNFYEGAMPEPWTFDPNDSDIKAMLRAIVGFRIVIDRLEGKWKLSQNQKSERQDAIIEALSTAADPNAQEIRALMIAEREKRKSRKIS